MRKLPVETLGLLDSLRESRMHRGRTSELGREAVVRCELRG